MRDFMDLFSLKGKKAIVTGGTRGLGYGMAEGLCRAGAEVAILGTSEKVRESADALARTTGGQSPNRFFFSIYTFLSDTSIVKYRTCLFIPMIYNYTHKK